MVWSASFARWYTAAGWQRGGSGVAAGWQRGGIIVLALCLWVTKVLGQNQGGCEPYTANNPLVALAHFPAVIQQFDDPSSANPTFVEQLIVRAGVQENFPITVRFHDRDLRLRCIPNQSLEYRDLGYADATAYRIEVSVSAGFLVSLTRGGGFVSQVTVGATNEGTFPFSSTRPDLPTYRYISDAIYISHTSGAANSGTITYRIIDNSSINLIRDPPLVITRAISVVTRGCPTLITFVPGSGIQDPQTMEVDYDRLGKSLLAPIYSSAVIVKTSYRTLPNSGITYVYETLSTLPTFDLSDIEPKALKFFQKKGLSNAVDIARYCFLEAAPVVFATDQSGLFADSHSSRIVFTEALRRKLSPASQEEMLKWIFTDEALKANSVAIYTNQSYFGCQNYSLLSSIIKRGVVWDPATSTLTLTFSKA